MALKKHVINFPRAPRYRTQRHGIACVEFAALAPILLLLFLGIVEVGQFVNVAQSVSNASREGARVAARNSTSNTSDVQTAVTTYLTQMHPTMPSSAVQVTVSDSGGSISGTALSSATTGSPIYVKVDVQFDSVHWINGLPLLSGRTITSTTATRRE